MFPLVTDVGSSVTHNSIQKGSFDSRFDFRSFKAMKLTALVRISSLVMTGLFLFAALVQYNDPDPVGWIILYSAAAGCSFLFWKRTDVRKPALAIIAAAWALFLIMVDRPDLPPTDQIFSQYPMSGEDAEIVREIGGLTLVSLWMLLITLCGKSTLTLKK